MAQEIQAELVGRLGTRGAIVLKSPAGGGKSTFVADTVGRLAGRCRLAVAAPTNEQIYSLVASIATAWPELQIHYVPAQEAQLPFRAPPNVTVCRPASTACGAQVTIGTLDKLGDALERGDLETVGCLIVDEAYQADSARYYRAAPIADVHLLVGDPGQIDPFAITPEALRYRGLAEDPVRTAVEVLLANHPDTPVHRLPITRRLDARALPLVRSFYESDHHFDAAVDGGARELSFTTALVRDRRMRELDAILRVAGTSGIAHVELPAGASLVADPEVVDVISTLACRALEPRLTGTMRCERYPNGGRRLTADRIAVGASHREQVRTLRRELRRRGHPDVVVETANKLQGAEFDLVICLHPLSGLPQADVFHLEAGRMCVLATRHRHACIVVGRASDRELLGGVPPSGDAWLGSDDEPLLEGWETHEAFFSALEPYRRPLAA
jgi:AAA domain-containing protein